MRIMYSVGKIASLAALVLPLTATVVVAGPSAKNQKVIDHWTPARMAQAIPRQLVIGSNGLGYLKRPDGSLQPHGHNRLVEVSKTSVQPQPRAKPGTGGDSQGPIISLVEPGDGVTIGASQTFTATITDTDGVRSADLVIIFPDGGSQTFSMSNSSGDTWESNLTGFTTSTGWSWYVEAKDASKGKGNSSVSDEYFFDVSTNGGPEPPPPGDGIVTNSPWDGNDSVRWTVGRIYFQMPTNSRLKRWAGYVLSLIHI
mgnify:FL=1